jgi:hypothetical protein
MSVTRAIVTALALVNLKPANILDCVRVVRSVPRIGSRAAHRHGKSSWSKESVGDIGFRQFAKCMIQGDFCDMEGAEVVGFSHRQFGLVVEALNDAAGELLFGTEVVQDQRARCERSELAIFFIGSVRDRMTWRHHSSRNLPAQLGDSYSQSC